MDVTNRLLFAVPKKGRLNEKVMRLLEHIDVKFQRSARQDIALCTNMDVTIVFLPASDVALYVGQGRVDMGITGRDMVAEKNVDVQELAQLGFGKCRLCVQAPTADKITDVKQLCGKRIVTSFPNLARKFFSALESGDDNKTRIDYVSGSVEAACGLGLADGIVDLVETGETMRAAGLEIVGEVMSTEAVLIGNTRDEHKDMQTVLTQRILGSIAASKCFMIEYNVPLASLERATAITPGRRSATVSQTAEPDWVAVKAVILQKDSNGILDKLALLGATDIIVFNIHNLR